MFSTDQMAKHGVRLASTHRLMPDRARRDALRLRAIFAATELDGEREKEALKAFLRRVGG